MLLLAKELGFLLGFLGESPGSEFIALLLFFGGSATVMTGLFGPSGDPDFSRTDLRSVVSNGRYEAREVPAQERTLTSHAGRTTQTPAPGPLADLATIIKVSIHTGLTT